MIESFEKQFQLIIEAAPQIVAAIIAFIILLIVGKMAANVADKILTTRGTRTIKQSRLIKRLVRWFFNLLGLIVALNIIGLTQIAVSFLAAGGFMAVILGFAFREIGENLLAGLFLSFSRSFDVGDLVESNGIRGVVKRIEIKDVRIRTADGCDIFIPSASLYKNPLHNFTRDGLRRGDFTIGLDYGDDLEGAIKVLYDTIHNSSLTLADPPVNIQISNFTPTFVELQIYFWINIFKSETEFTDARSNLMNECHKALSKHNFTFSSNVTTAIDMLPVQVKLNNDIDQNSDSNN